MLRSFSHQMVNEVQIDGGFKKPTYRDVFAIRLFIIPYDLCIWAKKTYRLRFSKDNVRLFGSAYQMHLPRSPPLPLFIFYFSDIILTPTSLSFLLLSLLLLLSLSICLSPLPPVSSLMKRSGLLLNPLSDRALGIL